MADNTSYTTDGVKLPYSLDAEQVVLGALLVDGSLISDSSLDGIQPSFFYLPEHQAIFDVMKNKMLLGEAIDFFSVLEKLRAVDFFSGDDGKAYLLKLTETGTLRPNFAGCVKTIREKAEVRTLITTAREIIEDAMEPGVDTEQLFQDAEQRIYDIRQGRQTGALVPIRQIIRDNYETFNKLAGKDRDQYIGIPSGIATLDTYTTGLNRSDLIIVGARPGMGKTSFALTLARNIAMDGNKTVAFFCLEMSREQLVNRLLAAESGVNSQKLRTGSMDGDEWARIGEAAGRLMDAPLYFDDTSSLTVADIKTRLLRMEKIDLVVIDYLQLMQSNKRTENRVQEVSDITRNLKIMAKELHVPLMVCAQLSRVSERQANHRPGLADLRESGSIEQDADQVLLLYRDSYFEKDKELPEVEDNTTEIIVAKNRHGSTGKVTLSWNPGIMQFTSLDLVHGD